MKTMNEIDIQVECIMAGYNAYKDGTHNPYTKIPWYDKFKPYKYSMQKRKHWWQCGWRIAAIEESRYENND